MRLPPPLRAAATATPLHRSCGGDTCWLPDMLSHAYGQLDDCPMYAGLIPRT
jgi:hypothetical protein